MAVNSNFLWLLLPPMFVAFWCLVVFVISLASGWRKLAASFRATSKPDGKKFWMQSARLNGADYNGCLSVIVADAGLHLSVFPIFAIGHAPLLIPWANLGAFQTRRVFWMTYRETIISTPRNERVIVSFLNPKLIAAIEEKRLRNAQSSAFSAL